MVAYERGLTSIDAIKPSMVAAEVSDKTLKKYKATLTDNDISRVAAIFEGRKIEQPTITIQPTPAPTIQPSSTTVVEPPFIIKSTTLAEFLERKGTSMDNLYRKYLTLYGYGSSGSDMIEQVRMIVGRATNTKTTTVPKGWITEFCSYYHNRSAYDVYGSFLTEEELDKYEQGLDELVNEEA